MSKNISEKETRKLRSNSNSQERRNSVGDIAEYFQAKIIATPMGGRKTSGRNKEKDKEKEKELNEVRENIKALIMNDGMTDNSQSENANGEQTTEKSLNRDGQQHANHDNCDAHQSELREKHSVSTQTNEDELLKAIKELATKYQQIDDTLNDPRNGMSAQLAKTQEKVQELHTDINGAVSGLKVQMTKVTETAENNLKKIETMQNSQKRMSALLDENKRLVQELKIMQGLVHKVSQQSDHNTAQLLDATKRSMEQNLIIQGVDNTIEIDSSETSGNLSMTYKERCKHSALVFFKDVMGLDIDIEDIWKAHRTGMKKPEKVRPLIVKLAYSAKDLVMEHLAVLKGKSNPKTKQVYFVSEQIPEGIAEQKKQTSARAKTLKDANDQKPKELRDQIQIINDKILINGTLDIAEVTTPKPSELFLNKKHQEEVDEMHSKFIETEPEYVRNSKFIGLAVKVHSIKEVQNAYIAVAQRYPASDHIMMGYALKEEGKLKSGFCDDKEYGAGGRIRKTIAELKARNTAVFVLRKYGGMHLGFGRFATIEAVSKTAINALPK